MDFTVFSVKEKDGAESFLQVAYECCAEQMYDEITEDKKISVNRRNNLRRWSTSQRDTCLAVEGNSRIAAHEECVHFTYFDRNVFELEDEVQEFEPNQDAGTRQILSVQVGVSDVRLLRPSTRLVLAMNSMDVGRREGARGVIDTAARYTVAGRAWDRACRQICAERGIGHLINVMPGCELYRFGNGGLLTSTERVTVPVVLADHPLLLSYSVVESPVFSLLIGRDVVESLGLDIKCSSKTSEYNGRSQPLEDSVAGHYCVTLSPERYAGLLKLENSSDPSTSRLRPRPTSLVPRNCKSRRV